MLSRLTQLYEAIGTRDLVQIAILALVVYGLLRFLSKTGAGSTIGRGLGLFVVAFFLIAQIVIASLDLAELSAVLDYILFGSILAFVVLFQPELRRGLMMLGRTKIWQGRIPTRNAIADPLADAAEAMSRDGVGGLICIQREVSLAPFIETGERIEAKLSAQLIRTIFIPRSPLHDGAVIVVKGRVVAAGCQLPMGAHDRVSAAGKPAFGMRHRAALALSEETDAIILVVSEETGRISLAWQGRFEPLSGEDVARRLVDLLNSPRLAA